MDTKVLIAAPTGEYARRADFYDFYEMLDKPFGTMCMRPHDRSPAKARNVAIQEAFNNNCTHILFVDDDMAYKADALNRLLAHDRDVVSGIYLGRMYPHVPLIFDLVDEEGACFPIYLTDGLDGLVPIVAAGFGFVLIKMHVFEKMEKPYVRLGELNKEEWCDDIGFFKRLREQTGVQCFCDLNVKLGHMGTMIMWANQVDGKWFTGYDTGFKEMVATPQISPQMIKEIKDMNMVGK